MRFALAPTSERRARTDTKPCRVHQAGKRGTRVEEYDFLAIPTGSVLDVARAVVDQGQSIAIVEEGLLGGTCLNRWCLLSKMLLYHVDVMETVERAGQFGTDADTEDV